jgi:hypothetical protein
VSEQVSSGSQIADKALGAPTTLSPVFAMVLQTPGPARTLYKAVLMTQGDPGLFPQCCKSW